MVDSSVALRNFENKRKSLPNGFAAGRNKSTDIAARMKRKQKLIKPFQARHQSFQNSIRNYKPKFFGPDIKTDFNELSQLPPGGHLQDVKVPQRIPIFANERKQSLQTTVTQGGDGESRNVLREILRQSIQASDFVETEE